MKYALLFASIALFLSGCATTHSHRVEGAHACYVRGDFDQAAEQLQRQMRWWQAKRREVLQLDLATVELARGNVQSAETLFRDLRDRLDHNSEADAIESLGVLITDDASRAYAGTGYEQVMIRVMASLASLMRDGGDAEAYALQAIDHQAKLAERAGQDGVEVPAGLYQPVAVAPYLRGLLRESSLHDYDDASRAYRLVSELRPNFQLASFDIQRASAGVHSHPGHGVLYVFALVGRGPIREPQEAEVTSASLLVADRIMSAVGKHSLPPTLAPVMIPKVVVPHGEATAVQIALEKKIVAQTETVTDVAQLAYSTSAAEEPRTIARAVTRRVLKKAAVYGTKEATGINSPVAELGMDLVGVAWEATEKCDTRCWGLLPREIQVARLELPAGTHRIGLQVASPFHARYAPQMEMDLAVTDGQNTYVLAIAPDEKIIAAPVGPK